jgi:hypothetical protein
VGIDNRGEPVLDVRTITLEARELEDDDDRVVRKSLRAASAQALRDIATQVTHPQFQPSIAQACLLCKAYSDNYFIVSPLGVSICLGGMSIGMSLARCCILPMVASSQDRHKIGNKYLCYVFLRSHSNRSETLDAHLP